ncbi:hypothetical protein ACTQ6A_06810 [Lachnospiraceae bacterium LCP25S3_G4]
MAFLSELILAVIKMIVIGAIGFGGIILGKNLRTKKEAKKAIESNN